MKITAAYILFAASLAVADVTYSVANFTASCIQHGSLCFYDFNVLQPGTMETSGVECSASASAIGVGGLPSVTQGTCLQSSRTFSVNKTDCGLELTVSQQVTPISYQLGNYIIPKNHILNRQDGASFAQIYVGPTEFYLAGLFPSSSG